MKVKKYVAVTREQDETLEKIKDIVEANNLSEANQIVKDKYVKDADVCKVKTDKSYIMGLLK